MTTINSKQFKVELKQKKLAPLYLFTGEEEGEKDKFIEVILKLIFKTKEERKNSLGRFNLENKELLEAANFILSTSIFSNQKICLLKNIDALPALKKEKSILKEIITNLPAGHNIIMTTLKNRPPAIISKENLAKIKIVQFWPHFNNELQNYIKAKSQRLNLKLDQQGISVLLEYTGQDIKKIDHALNSISSAILEDENKRIDRKSIKTFLVDEKKVSIFNLIDSLFQKKRETFRILKKLSDDNTPNLLILSMIMKRAELIEKYHLQIKKGQPKGKIIKELSLTSRQQDLFFKQTEIFPLKKIKKVFPLMAKTDYLLKNDSFANKMITNPLLLMIMQIIWD